MLFATGNKIVLQIPILLVIPFTSKEKKVFDTFKKLAGKLQNIFCILFHFIINYFFIAFREVKEINESSLLFRLKMEQWN